MEGEPSNIRPMVSKDPRVTVGRFTYGAPALWLTHSHDRNEIGAFGSISLRVTIFGGGEHHTQRVSTYPLNLALGCSEADKELDVLRPSRPTIIGNDVWIGAGATILSEVTIGDGAVIGAGAVVASDVPPYAVVYGNPAKVGRMRFEPHQVEALLRIRWWDWPIDRIREALPRMSSTDIDAFIAYAAAFSPEPTEG